MSKIDEAIGLLRGLPPERRESVAALVITLAEESGSFDYTQEEMERLDRSEAAATRGDFATDEQVRAIWAKHGL